MKLAFVKEALGKQHHLLVGEGYCRFRIVLGAGEDSLLPSLAGFTHRVQAKQV